MFVSNIVVSRKYASESHLNCKLRACFHQEHATRQIHWICLLKCVTLPQSQEKNICLLKGKYMHIQIALIKKRFMPFLGFLFLAFLLSICYLILQICTASITKKYMSACHYPRAFDHFVTAVQIL